jgi:hypothetical protein
MSLADHESPLIFSFQTFDNFDKINSTIAGIIEFPEDTIRLQEDLVRIRENPGQGNPRPRPEPSPQN